jgi:hypothetical protein
MLASKCALVIPSSVYVSAGYTRLRDHGQRLEQYVEAIGWYIRETKLEKIIVCDNSGFQYPGALVDIAAAHGKQLELLSFTGDSALVAEYGKGYGEGQIMEFVLANSRLIKEVEGFLKVTGRLKVVNIDRVLPDLDSSQNYFLPISLLRPRFLVAPAARVCVEVRVYYTTRAFFLEVLLTAYKAVRDDETFFLEQAYYRAITSSPRSVARVKVFPRVPEITGMSGSNGWIFKERSWPKKMLIRLVAKLGYIRPV